MKKRWVRLKRCRRCEDIFEAKGKYSKICDSCNKTITNQRERKLKKFYGEK